MGLVIQMAAVITLTANTDKECRHAHVSRCNEFVYYGFAFYAIVFVTAILGCIFMITSICDGTGGGLFVVFGLLVGSGVSLIQLSKLLAGVRHVYRPSPVKIGWLYLQSALPLLLDVVLVVWAVVRYRHDNRDQPTHSDTASETTAVIASPRRSMPISEIPFFIPPSREVTGVNPQRATAGPSLPPLEAVTGVNPQRAPSPESDLRGECPVCQEVVGLHISAPCGHPICRVCYKALERRACPSCRRPIEILVKPFVAGASIVLS